MPIYPKPKNTRPVNTVLSKVVAGYANAPENFLQDRLLPVLFDGSNVPEGQDKFVTGTLQRWKSNAMFGDPSANPAVARGETYPRSRGGDFDPLTFEAIKYGRICEVPYEDITAFQGGPAPYEMHQLSVSTQEMRIEREKILAGLFMTDANFPGTALGAAAKWDQATSDPNGDFIDAVDAVEAYGVTPNVCILGRAAASLLRQNAAFLEFDDVRLDRTVMNDERIAAVIKARYGVDHVFIGKATYNTSHDPDAAPVLANIWDDDVWVGFLPMDGNGSPTAGPTAGAMGAQGDLIPMQKMAAGKVTVDGWKVYSSDEFDKDLMLHKIRYYEGIFVVSSGYGYQVLSVRT